MRDQLRVVTVLTPRPDSTGPPTEPVPRAVRIPPVRINLPIHSIPHTEVHLTIVVGPVALAIPGMDQAA